MACSRALIFSVIGPSTINIPETCSRFSRLHFKMYFEIVHVKTYTLLSSTYPSRSNKRVLGDLMKPSLLFKTTRDVGYVDPNAMVKSKERGMSPCKH